MSVISSGGDPFAVGRPAGTANHIERCTDILQIATIGVEHMQPLRPILAKHDRNTATVCRDCCGFVERRLGPLPDFDTLAFLKPPQPVPCSMGGEIKQSPPAETRRERSHARNREAR